MKHSSLQDAYAGQFYQEKPSLNTNTALNFVLSRPVGIQTYSEAIVEQEIQFPDVSFYQEEINYPIMRLNTDTIIIRIGQNLWPDDQFERNYLEAKKQGMRVGGYWFYDDRVSPREQAELLVALCEGKTFELEIYIDWENSYGGAFGGLRNVVAMMELVEMAIQMNIFIAKDVGMYTGYYFFRGNSNPITNTSQYAYLKNKPLWLAWYTDNPTNVLIPAPWIKLTLWQWGTPTWNWGQATREIDMNWWNGSRQEFEERYGESGEVPMADYMELKSNTSVGRSVREAVAYPQVPHIFGSRKDTLLASEVAKALPDGKYVYTSDVWVSGTVQARTGDIWWEIYEIRGEPATGWIAEKHLGQVLLTVTPKTESTPAPSHIVEVFIDGELVYRKELV
jgi:GH25 family lysozyme M1 (1,4-beta-N-acetylmuramidase)